MGLWFFIFKFWKFYVECRYVVFLIVYGIGFFFLVLGMFSLYLVFLLNYYVNVGFFKVCYVFIGNDEFNT